MCIRDRYGDTLTNILQMQNEKTASINYQSDRKINKKIFNKWLNEDIEYSINKLENGQVEYEAVLTKKNVVCLLYTSPCYRRKSRLRQSKRCGPQHSSKTFRTVSGDPHLRKRQSG